MNDTLQIEINHALEAGRELVLFCKRLQTRVGPLVETVTCALRGRLSQASNGAIDLGQKAVVELPTKAESVRTAVRRAKNAATSTHKKKKTITKVPLISRSTIMVHNQN
jgi:hypothetical protein